MAMAPGYLGTRVAARIRSARENAATALDLSSCSLQAIPDEVYSLSDLTELDLFENRIQVVPDRIRELSQLRRLNLFVNPVRRVPNVPSLLLDWSAYDYCKPALSPENVIGINIITGEDQQTRNEVPNADLLLSELKRLPFLRELRIGTRSITFQDPISPQKPITAITDVIDCVADFAQLRSLGLIGLRLGQIPDGVRALRQLRDLWLVGVGLREAPQWLCELDQLGFLSLDINELETLPMGLENLSLRVLSASGNRFSRVPEVIFRILSLTQVRLDGWKDLAYTRQIKQIPLEIIDLPNLKTLSLQGQAIESPPAEVASQGIEAIKNYWRQQQESGIDYLCEAKLIIIGEAGAGKTSLAKKIQNHDYHLRPAETSTEGIEIAHWRFPAAVRVRHENRQELLQRDFQVNIWDFGGQEIYHATHQFFLTRRSVYVLVADDRKEDTDYNYWLQIVELLGGDSPLVIAQNEKQDRRRDIDVGTLRARFENLKQAYRINLSDNRGLDELVKAIQRELESLPHIGVALPATWKRVRQALENDPRNYIGIDEYLAICGQHGFRRREDKLQLSRYLHDLGICLHFQDDPVLYHTVILKTTWGTDAVYRALDDPILRENHGRFGREDLTRIWADEQYARMQHELLRLMINFHLCYELPGGQSYITPQLLSPNAPSYDWEARGNLVVRYEYEFMPKGIITRFIVTLNHLIANQNLVWKRGVVLDRHSTRAEIIEDYARRQISVRVSGADPRGLLAIVDDQLERIHNTFSRLKYEKFLPCNCFICRDRTDPYLFKLGELKDFATTQDSIQCRISRGLVNAGELIRDVFPAWGKLAPGDVDLCMENTAVPGDTKEVFVSYSWEEQSTELIDQLQKALDGSGIKVHRDRDELKYKESIWEFMRRMGDGKCVIVVISKDYLQSTSCMFELLEIAGRGDVRDRVFPVVLDDAGIYDAAGRLDYVKYWESRAAELDSKMKTVGSANLSGIREDIDLFTKIRGTIAEIVNVLGDMNAFTAKQHRDSNYQELIRAVEKRLSE